MNKKILKFLFLIGVFVLTSCSEPKIIESLEEAIINVDYENKIFNTKNYKIDCWKIGCDINTVEVGKTIGIDKYSDGTAKVRYVRREFDEAISKDTYLVKTKIVDKIKRTRFVGKTIIPVKYVVTNEDSFRVTQNQYENVKVGDYIRIKVEKYQWEDGFISYVYSIPTTDEKQNLPLKDMEAPNEQSEELSN